MTVWLIGHRALDGSHSNEEKDIFETINPEKREHQSVHETIGGETQMMQSAAGTPTTYGPNTLSPHVYAALFTPTYTEYYVDGHLAAGGGGAHYNAPVVEPLSLVLSAEHQQSKKAGPVT